MHTSTRTTGIGGHQRAHRGATDIWLTPPEIIDSLGVFDLDPCCPDEMPWRTAVTMLVEQQDGLTHAWHGRVWLNPPYGPETGKWLAKLKQHGNGIALIFARTETAMFHDNVWDGADATLFLRGRLHFHYADGSRAKANAGGPSALVAYGQENVRSLRASGIDGALIETTQPPEGLSAAETRAGRLLTTAPPRPPLTSDGRGFTS